MSSHFLKYILGAFCLAAIFSCQTTPTKGINQGQVAVEESQDPIRSFLKLKPVILDARNPLDFSVSHAPGAISAQWQDFNKVQPGHRGLLQEDELAIARRLSLWGIDPETPVTLFVGVAVCDVIDAAMGRCSL